MHRTTTWLFFFITQRAASTPSLEVLKARLDGALGSLIWWVAALPMAGGWHWVGFKVPFNPNNPVIV